MVSYSFIQNKTDIQNFFGNSTYMSLMEHLKELHPKEVQAYVLEELHIYGNSRIGMLKLGMNIVELDEEMEIGFEAVPPTEYFGRNLGQKRYELSNHLGNTLVTVTDKKVYVDGSSGIEFEPEITSISDYYPYGAPIASRAYSIVEYRYGFNGQELENEISGDGNVLSATFWEYDTRLARRWNIDPVDKEFESPYACFAGNPVLFADPNGDDASAIIAGTVGFGVGAYVGGWVATGEWNPANWEGPEALGGALIGGAALGGTSVAITYLFNIDVAKIAKDVSKGISKNPTPASMIFAGGLNMSMNNYEGQSVVSKALYFAGGALGALATNEFENRATGLSIGILTNMAMNQLSYEIDGVINQMNGGGRTHPDKRIVGQAAWTALITQYASWSLHQNLSGGKELYHGEKWGVLTKGIEYGIINYALTWTSTDMTKRSWDQHALAFGVGFANGALQQYAKNHSKVNKHFNTSIAFVLNSADALITNAFVIYNDDKSHLSDSERKKARNYELIKAEDKYKKKATMIIVKSILFNVKP